MALAALKNLTRLAEVAAVLTRHGFADLVERLELPGRHQAPAEEAPGEKHPLWARIRRVAEDLGPTFVKLGQLMSQRPDLLPVELVLELRKLQDQVAPESREVIVATVERALDRPLAEVFGEFSPEPLASASLAQVHRARRLDDGRAVAVKVRRPGIVKMVEADLALLAGLAKGLHQRVEQLKPYNLPGLVKEIASHLRQEMDFLLEARHMVTARAHLGPRPPVDIPAPHFDLSAPNLLTMDLVVGVRLERAGLEQAERAALAKELAGVILRQVLKDGFFHADPHPGNILVRTGLERPRLALLDWGLVGRLTPRMRYLVGDLLMTMVERDATEMVRLLYAMGAAPSGADQAGLIQDVEDLLDQVHSRPLSEIDSGQVILRVMEIMRAHRLQAQVQYALLDKALLEMEGVARELDPGFDPVEVAKPFVRGLWLERWRPDVMARSLRRHLHDGLELLKNLPQRLDLILGQLERGEMGFEFKHRGLVPLTKAIEDSSNRVTVGLIVAALIVGSSMIITTGVEPKIFGLPALGLVGYLISGVVGLWLVWSILKSGGGKF